MSKQQTRPARSGKKQWLIALALVVLLGVSFVVGLPFAVRYGVVRWLLAHGAQSADLEKIHINLFTGIASVSGLQVRLDDNLVLGDKNISVDFDLRALMKKEGHLETGMVEGLVLDIESGADGDMRIGSITVPADPDQPEQKKDMSWLFRASHLELRNCEVRYNLPTLRHTIKIDHGVLENLFTGRADHPGTLVLEGSVNGTPVSLRLDRIELKPHLVVGGHIAVQGYRLENLQQLLKASLDPIAGAVGLDGTVLFSLDDSGGMTTEYDGRLTVSRGHVGNSSFSTRSPLLAYTGTIHYAQSAATGIGIDLDGVLQGDKLRVGVPGARLQLDEQQLKLEGKTSISIGGQLQVTTDGSLDFSGLSLDLPTMHVAHSGMHWQGKVTYLLEEGQSIKAGGRLSLNNPAYQSFGEGFNMQSGAERVSWDGDVNVDIGGTSGVTTVVTNGLLSGNAYVLNIPDMLDFSEETVLVNGKTELVIGSNLHLTSRTHQQHRGIAVVAANTESHGTMSWQGRVDYQKKGANSELLLDGQLAGNELVAQLNDQHWTIAQQEIAFLPEKLRLTLGNPVQLNGKGTFSGSKLTIENKDATLLSVDTMALNGISGQKNGGVRAKVFTVTGVQVPRGKNQPVAVDIPQISVQSIRSPDFKTVTISGVQLSQPVVRNVESKTMLARLDQINVRKVRVENPLVVSVDAVTAGKGYFLQQEKTNKKPLISLNQTTMEKISWSGRNGVSCDTITLDTVRGEFIREKSTKEKKPQEQDTPEPDKNKAPSDPPKVKIHRIAVTGNSGFTFTDKSTSKPFFTEFVLRKAEVKNIDLAATDTPIPYELNGVFDTWSPLDISGSYQPASEGIALKSTIRLRNYSLEAISPYVVDTIGTKFIDGQLYITSEVNVNGEDLDLDNNLVCREIKSETVSEEAQGALSLPVPLDMALSMLRDNNGDIDLDMPVSGTLSDFSVGMADIIITALSKALVTAVTPYLAYSALGPAGAVAYVGLQAGKDAMKESLPLLEFDFQVTTLSAEQKTLLQTVGKSMAANTDQDYTVCSKAMAWEFDPNMEKTAANKKKILENPEKRQQLLALSRDRAVNIRTFLEQNFNPDPDHLLICPPSIHYELTGQPVVKIRKLEKSGIIQGMLP